MSYSVSQSIISEEKKKKLLLEELPDDFLRIDCNSKLHPDTDQQLAIALDRQLNSVPSCSSVGRLNITIDQAKLVKNYGLSRMDPYVRLRVGHCVYETQTDSNGGKNPRWNKVVQCLLPSGVNTLSIEIFDECSFTMDELIAWAQIFIPESVFSGQTHEEWFPLSGKQGDGQEGAINLVISFFPVPVSYGLTNTQSVMMVPHTGHSFFGLPTKYSPIPVYQTTYSPHQQIKQMSQNDIKMIEEMFPNLDKDVIKSVLDASCGNRDSAINTLLQMS